MKTCLKLHGLFLALGTALVHPRAATTLTSDHDNYFPEEVILMTFKDGPGNKKDWVGLYPKDIVPGSVGSTIWNYVDSTQAGNTGYREGVIRFGQGLRAPGEWDAHFLQNDGFTSLAKITIHVVESFTTLARVSKRVYAPGESISVTFTNGPANKKDWIAVYQEGQTPGAPGITSTLWNYVDGTRDGNTGKSDGTIIFSTGLTAPGKFFTCLLENDGYTILASETFVVEVPPAAAPRVTATEPGAGETNVAPNAPYVARLQTSSRKVDPASVRLLLDDQSLAAEFSATNDTATVRYASNAALPPMTPHTYRLIFSDTTGATFTNDTKFTVVDYSNLRLSTPIHLETFDGLAEGQLPQGWTGVSYSAATDEEINFGDLNSAAFKGWTTVNVDRFRGRFITYGNPEDPVAWQEDYQRVLTPSRTAVINGSYIHPLASGKMLFGNSGYRNGGHQVLFLTTSDYDLSGKTNVRLAFKSLYEQNQDSFGSLEYSIDKGQTWLPLLYLLDRNDIRTNDTGAFDAELTLSEEYGDVARFTDDSGAEKGGRYGDFIGAPVSASLMPFIRGGFDDDAARGKTVEHLKLTQADNQKTVRFRLSYAGTDSWYWGIDDFGLYAAAAVADVVEVLTSSTLTGTFAADPGAEVDANARTITLPANGLSRFVRLKGASRITTVRIQGGNLVLGY